MQKILFIESPLWTRKFLGGFKNSKRYKIIVVPIDGLQGLDANQFDFCIFSPLSPICREKILNFFRQCSSTYKIIEVHDQKYKCLYDINCAKCLEHNMFIVDENITPENLIFIIENLHAKTCKKCLENNLVAYLSKTEYFCKCDLPKIQSLLKHSMLKSYSKDDFILYEGDCVTHFYFLIDGSVSKFIVSTKNVDIVLSEIFEKSFLCIAESLTSEMLHYSVKAISDSSILMIERDFLLKFIQTESDFAYFLLKSLAKNTNNVNKTILRTQSYDAMKKTIVFLNENPQAIDFKSKKDIAHQLGMNPATLSRILKQLKTMGILK